MAYIQKVSNSVDATGTSVNMTLTGVTAGKTLAVLIGSTSSAVGQASWGNPTDSAGQTWAKAVGPVSVGASSIEQSMAAIYYLLSANAGTHTLTFTVDASSYLTYTFVEMPTCTAVDQTQSSGGTTSTTSGSTGTTGTTTQADEIVLALLTTNTSGAGLANAAFTNPPSGYTSLYVENATNAHTGGQHSYLEVSATGTQSAAWTWTTGAQTSWQAVIATFKRAAAASTELPPLSMPPMMPPMGARR